jgi:multidrug efflux pump subunit AcrA (membrane-fusion protein)
MKKSVCILAAFVLFFGFLPILGAQVTAKVTLLPVREKEVFNRIYYGARIEPAAVYAHYAPISGVVEEIRVSSGDPIREGAILMTLRRDQASQSYRPVEVPARKRGTVAEVSVEAGEPVSQNQRLLDVVDVSAVKAVIGVSDQDIGLLREGDAVTVSTAGGGSADGNAAEGIVRSIAVLPDYSTGLYDVTVRINGTAGIRLGRFVRVELKVNSFQGTVIAKQHIQRKYGKPHVWVYAEGKAVLREIVTGGEYGDEIAVTGGLEPGEQIIANSSRMLNDGDAVEVEGS